MKYIRNIAGQRYSRFLFVGAGNTAINFTILNFTFYTLHQNKIVSSILATSCAISFSFTLNKGFVFKDKTQPLKKFAQFTIVSIAGMLLVQTSTYAIGVFVLRHLVSSNFILINVSNLIASFVVMFWNYNCYRLLVFKGTDSSNDPTEESSQEPA